MDDELELTDVDLPRAELLERRRQAMTGDRLERQNRRVRALAARNREQHLAAPIILPLPDGCWASMSWVREFLRPLGTDEAHTVAAGVTLDERYGRSVCELGSLQRLLDSGKLGGGRMGILQRFPLVSLDGLSAWDARALGFGRIVDPDEHTSMKVRFNSARNKLRNGYHGLRRHSWQDLAEWALQAAWVAVDGDPRLGPVDSLTMCFPLEIWFNHRNQTVAAVRSLKYHDEWLRKQAEHNKEKAEALRRQADRIEEKATAEEKALAKARDRRRRRKHAADDGTVTVESDDGPDRAA